MTNIELNEEELALYERTATDEEVETFYTEAALAHTEMEMFFDTLPAETSDEQMFALFMMQDGERKAWLSANAPVVEAPVEVSMERAPYFPAKLYKERKPERIGNVRI